MTIRSIGHSWGAVAISLAAALAVAGPAQARAPVFSDTPEPHTSLVETPTKDFEAPAFREPETSEPPRPATRSNVRMRKPSMIEKSGSTKAKPDDEWRRRILQW